ncbi:MAG TPA: hypothetical protein PL182_08855 [Pseudobdellovibrionaceae bacterium]|nr:hypothetical protein [Pseudobdellovibrionaceae bacterium]
MADRKNSSIFLSALAIWLFAGAAAASTLQEAQALKSRALSEETALSRLVDETRGNEAQIKALAGQRRLFQRKSQAEKDLIKANKENAKKIAELERQIVLSQERLRSAAKEMLRETDRDYLGTGEVIRELEPILAHGAKVVNQLKAARSVLSTSLLSSGLNATTSTLKTLDGSEPTALDALAQVAAQAAASRALRDGQNALRAAAVFDDQLSVFARSDRPLLGGSWSAAVNRGMIYYLVTAGRNPLTSNGFNLSNSLFQMSDLSAMKTEVQNALKIVEPIVNQMNDELSGLFQDLKRAEDELIGNL